MRRCIKCNHKAIIFVVPTKEAFSYDNYRVKCSFCDNTSRLFAHAATARKQWNHQNENVIRFSGDK